MRQFAPVLYVSTCSLHADVEVCVYLNRVGYILLRNMLIVNYFFIHSIRRDCCIGFMKIPRGATFIMSLMSMFFCNAFNHSFIL